MNLDKREIVRQLEKLPLILKVLLTVFFTVIFFSFVFFIKEENLLLYFLVLFIVLILIGAICYFVIGRKAFLLTIKLWAAGTLIYLVISITYKLLGGIIVPPYIDWHNDLSIWLYLLTHPLRLLAIFFVGLIFLEIISPIEFLRYGKIGLKVAFLFRMIEYAKQAFLDTQEALRMHDKWPEETSRFSFHNTYMRLKYSPTLVLINP